MQKKVDTKWWRRRWSSFVETLTQPSTATRSNDSTSVGWRIVRLDVDGTEIRAQLKNRAAECADITVAFVPFTDSQWAAVVADMARLYTIQRLEEQLSAELEQVFSQVALTLFPATAEDIVQTCTCGDNHELLCPPLHTLYETIGDMIVEDPWLLLQLSGRNRRQILSAIQAEQNGQETTTSSVAYNTTSVRTDGKQLTLNQSRNETESTALIDEIDNFWGRRKQIESIQHHMSSPTIDLILLRRLGAPAADEEGEMLYDLFAKLYRQISEKALSMAYATHENEEV